MEMEIQTKPSISMRIINEEDGIGMDINAGGGSGTTDHRKLKNLDYEHSGHTGFQPAGNYLTEVPSEYKTKDENDQLYQPKGNYISDSNYVHTDNNYTTEEKNKLAELENKFANVELDYSTMTFNYTAEQINNLLQQGYVVTAMGYQIFYNNYNSSTNTLEVAIYSGDIGQIITITGNMLTNIEEIYYVSDRHYVHTDNNYTSTEKNKLSNIRTGTVSSGDTGYVTGDSVYNALEQATTYDNNVTSSSDNAVKSSGIYNFVHGNFINISISQNDWSGPSGTNDNYQYFAVGSCPIGTFDDDSIIELINNNYEAFSKYGFVCYDSEISSQRLWFAAIDKPTTNINLQLRVIR